MMQVIGLLGGISFSLSCAVAPSQRGGAPISISRQFITERAGAVIVAEEERVMQWYSQQFAPQNEQFEANGGSISPITADGYFLTADHVLAQSNGRNIFAIFSQNIHQLPIRVRVIWRSKVADLALLHAPVRTPLYYRWTPVNEWVYSMTPIVHGGVSTGRNFSIGKTSTQIAPDSRMVSYRSFKMDLPLQPGDSGGPVVDGNGRLVGINSAVEFLVPMETAFFLSSEGNRPNIAKIEGLIAKDRARKFHP